MVPPRHGGLAASARWRQTDTSSSEPRGRMRGAPEPVWGIAGTGCDGGRGGLPPGAGAVGERTGTTPGAGVTPPEKAAREVTDNMPRNLPQIV